MCAWNTKELELLVNWLNYFWNNSSANDCLRARSLVVSDLRSEAKGSQFKSGCWLWAEVNSTQ